MGFLEYIKEQDVLEFTNLILEKADVDVKETASKEANKMMKMSEKDFDKAGDKALGELIKFAKKHKLEKNILTSINKKTGKSYTSLEKMRKELKTNDVSENLDEGFKEFIAKGNAIKNGILSIVIGITTTAIGNAVAVSSILLGDAGLSGAGATSTGAIGGTTGVISGAGLAAGGVLLIFITIITRVIFYIMKKINIKKKKKD